MKLTLPIDSKVRKDIPLYSGNYKYFPAALAGVAVHSKMGNDKHNPGQPLHHARGKSTDHPDCIARHMMDVADMLRYLEDLHDIEGLPPLREDPCTMREVEQLLYEANALCWRALAWSQELHERFGGAPLAPAAREPLDLTLL